MKRLPWVAVGSLFIFFACATLRVGQKPPQKTPELLNIGKKLYQENCVQCHGIEGDGRGPKSVELKIPPRNFTLPFDQWTVSKGNPIKIFEVLKNGIPDTPMAMFHFSDEERWGLVYRVMEFSKGGKAISLNLFQDGPGSKKAGKTGSYDTVRGPGVVANLKEARNRSPMGRP